MPTAKTDVIRLRHMLDASRKAILFTKAKSRRDLDVDEQLSLALVRLLEIVGEAATTVTPEGQNRYSTIPWKTVIGTRNRLIHGYYQVNLDVLWQIVSTDLPALVIELQKAIDNEEQQQKLF
ncbi:MAG TPA: HepT-like ribonuclease domain-containing protein [Bacteroidota bacterium]